MIKTIKTNSGKEIELSNAAAFLYVYKNQFGQEPLKDIFALQKSFAIDTAEEEKEADYTKIMEDFELTIAYNLAWALAKMAKPSSIKDPITFFTEYDDFYPLDHIETILEMALGSLSISAFKVDEEEKN